MVRQTTFLITAPLVAAFEMVIKPPSAEKNPAVQHIFNIQFKRTIDRA
jgi:hypothetical protein